LITVKGHGDGRIYIYRVKHFNTFIAAEAALRFEERGIPIRRILEEVEEYLKDDVDSVGYIQEHHTAITLTIYGRPVIIEYEIIGDDIYIY